MRRIILAAVFGMTISSRAFAYDGSPPAPTAPLEDTQEVIIATQRNRRLHFFDPATLASLGSIIVNHLAHSVSAAADGHTLFIEQAETPDGNGCCALFSIDLVTGAMCQIKPSGVWGNFSHDNRRQLVRVPATTSRYSHRWYPSIDNRWLFGFTKNMAGSQLSFDLYNYEKGKLVRRFFFPSHGEVSQMHWPDGAWIGERFHFYVIDDKQSSLWTVTPSSATLGAPVKVEPPGIAVDCGMKPLYNLFAAGDRLFLYEQFGMKLDRRDRCGKIVGGMFVIEPQNGEVTAHLAPSVQFSRLTASGDGRSLYGIDSGESSWRGPVRLLKLDAATGDVQAERVLERDVWFIHVATIRRDLVPRSQARPTLHCPSNVAWRAH